MFDITAGDTTTVAMEVICESAGAVLKDKIVFVSDQVDYREEIFTVNPEGSDFTQLTFGSERDKWIPSVSPDGSKIAYVSGEEIFIMNADGSDVTLFPHEGSNPSWSPDGNQLLISSDRDGNVEIYKINVDGSGPVINLTANSAEDTIPNWSPVE